MGHYFAIDWNNMVQIGILAPITYLFVIVSVRVAGIRSTSQMNSFDWIVTVAIGSLFASTIILENINLLEGAFSILLLLGLQFIVTKMVSRFPPFGTLLKATPQLLLFRGSFLSDNMQSQRITRSEVFSAIRQQGFKSTEDIYAVVLETNAKLSVIPNENNDALGFSLADVDGLPEGLKKDLNERGEEE